MKRIEGLLIGPDIVTRNARHLVDFKNAINWVGDPNKAMADYEAAAKATQEKLTALRVKTELVKIGKKDAIFHDWFLQVV